MDASSFDGLYEPQTSFPKDRVAIFVSPKVKQEFPSQKEVLPMECLAKISGGRSCNSTAPTPTPEASHSTIKYFEKLGRDNTGACVIASFRFCLVANLV